MTTAIDVLLHLNLHLASFVAAYGLWVYALLFLVVFCETGLVVTPILPGDSLLFAAGAVASAGGLSVLPLCLLLVLAAVLGDALNYRVGRASGTQLVRRFPKLIKPAHLERTQQFYERYGAKTIVLARFVPIVRTFAPFVAGIGSMRYQRFAAYNVVGAVLWVGLLVPAGYWFAEVPLVKDNFSAVVLAIVALSVTPIAWELLTVRLRARPAVP